MSTKRNIKLLSLQELEEWGKIAGLPAFRYRQIYEWLWKKNVSGFDQMTTLTINLRSLLSDCFSFCFIRISETQISKDGTQKIVFELNDGNKIESVLIPSEARITACISTQVGCQLACSFCATGSMGFIRNLEIYEIYEQVKVLNNICVEKQGHKISNIVYMGMGEPLLNYENTIASIMKLTDSKYGTGISPHRITVSTVGIPSGIRKLGDDHHNFQLAVSLHSAIQGKRERIMPVAKKYKLDELSEAIQYFHLKTKARVTIEYLLLHDFNDTESDAKELAKYCKSFPVKVNIIEYNEVENDDFRKSLPSRTRDFCKILTDKNMIVNKRQSRGGDIAAACGQLAKRK